tara:strand:- start:786 stop:1331 length:546 start_codon:yes stop_codon:yes gene_type:complete
MFQTRVNSLFERADLIEMRLCVLLNNSSRYTYIRLFFRVVSRLGDGMFWHALAVFLPYLHGKQGVAEAVHILITGLLVLGTYKFLKSRLVRERPFISNNIIKQAAPALDQYSFPSGHTMHAFSFAILFSYFLPELTSVVWGFAGLVAMSRVILGLHYPTDVVAGALLGSCLSVLSLLIMTG